MCLTAATRQHPQHTWQGPTLGWRRRRGSTVELSHIRFGCVYTEFATSWRQSTRLNKFANSEVELRRVGGVNAPVGSREL